MNSVQRIWILTISDLVHLRCLWCDTFDITERDGSKPVLHTGSSNHAVLSADVSTKPFCFCIHLVILTPFSLFVDWL